MQLRNKLITLLLCLLLMSSATADCNKELDKCNLSLEDSKSITAHQQQQLYGMRVDRDNQYERANKASIAPYILLGMYLGTVLAVIIVCEKCRQ